ncbi:hypothetical protein REPUB_Repub12eG0025500 [Reevesia pubescens]
MFIVWKDNGCGIGELKELDLGNELCIKELDNVTGSTEAKSANLMRKQNLRSLSLVWGEHAGKFPDNEEEVLSSLQPHSNLEYLQICGYQGLRLPDWMIDVSNLVSVELDQCKRCSYLPPLGELPLLKFLKIRGMDAVKCIGSEFYGSGVNPFSSLEELSFDLMPNLETWKTVEGMGNFPSLQILTFKKCPKLMELPGFPTLKKFRIWTRNISRRGDLDQLDNLSMLKHLRLSSCNKLEDIPEALQNLKALESLILAGCDSLVSFPVNRLHGLTSLRILEIRHCERFASFSDGLMHLKQLEDLWLCECPMLNSLPKEIQHLNSLRKLTISWCDGLTFIPNQIEHLTLLSELIIRYCWNLMFLPQGLKSLTELKALKIHGCPHLEKR